MHVLGVRVHTFTFAPVLEEKVTGCLCHCVCPFHQHKRKCVWFSECVVAGGLPC